MTVETPHGQPEAWKNYAHVLVPHSPLRSAIGDFLKPGVNSDFVVNEQVILKAVAGRRYGNCADFALPFIPKDERENVFLHSEIFLKSYGFLPVIGKQEEGDIIAYRRLRGEIPDPWTEHFGVVASGGVIASKFGRMSVYIHDLQNVLPEYGEIAFFFRRK